MADLFSTMTDPAFLAPTDPGDLGADAPPVRHADPNGYLGKLNPSQR